MAATKKSQENKELKASLPDDPRIWREYEILSATYKDIPKNRKRLVRKLIVRAAFMAVTLEDLEKKISAEGCTSEYQNGENQWGTKKSPEVEVHIQMVKNYSSVIKQLSDMLPPEERGPTDDGFETFRENR